MLALLAALALSQCAPGKACQAGTMQLGPVLQAARWDGGQTYDGGLAPVCTTGLQGTLAYYRGSTVPALDGGVYLCGPRSTRWEQVASGGAGLYWPITGPSDATGRVYAGAGWVGWNSASAFAIARTDLASYLVLDATTATLSSATMTFSGNSNFTSGTISSSAANTPVTVSDPEGFRLTGVAHSSLATAAATGDGTVQWDTTHQRPAYRDGGWYHLAALEDLPAYIPANWSGVCFGVCGEEPTGFVGSYRPSAARTMTQVTCAWGTAGVGAGNAVVRVYDETGAAEVCSGTLGACTTAASVGMVAACAGSLSASKTYRLELKSTTDCATTNPGNIVCNVD